MLLLVVFTQMTQFWVAFGILCLAGVAHSLFSTLNQALLQLNAGEEYRARVMGLYTWAGGLEPFTVLGLGFLADKFGVTNTLGSSLAVAGVIAAFFALNQSRTELAAHRSSEAG